jgi:hypothetical protein
MKAEPFLDDPKPRQSFRNLTQDIINDGERPGALLARRTEDGMESDDLLCSRNALGLVCLVACLSGLSGSSE